MNRNDLIKHLRILHKYTQEGLAKKIGVSVTTVQSWEYGTKSPSADAIVALASIYRVSTDYILGVPKTHFSGSPIVSLREEALLSNFRALDTHGKKAVESICSIEKARIDEESRVIQISKPVKMIPRYVTPAAAGYSNPLDTTDYEMIPVTGNVPVNADYAVRIQGNSMEPYIFDGDTVYVKSKSEISNGDIGVFCVDGSMYCKQYYMDNEGNLSLISANEALKDSNVYVPADSGISVECCGVVLI